MPRCGRTRRSAVVLLRGRTAGAGDSRRVPPEPVREPVEPLGARALDRSRDVAADGRARHPLRRRCRHRRDDHGCGPILEDEEPRCADRRCRSGGVRLLGRIRPPVPRRRHWRGFLAEHVRPDARRPGCRHQRSRQLLDGAPRDGRRGHPHRRFRWAPLLPRRSRSARTSAEDHLVVVLIPDSGRGYLSRVFDDDWMAGYGFLHSEGRTVADVIRARAGDVPPLVYVHPNDTVAPRREPDARSRCLAAARCEGRAAAGCRRGSRRGRRAGVDGPRHPR